MKVLPQTADDAATVHFWSDREPATVIKRTAKTVTVQTDDARALNKVPYGGYPDYEYTRNEQGSTWTFSLRKNGRYVRVGEPARTGTSVSLGRRDYYRDPHF